MDKILCITKSASARRFPRPSPPRRTQPHRRNTRTVQHPSRPTFSVHHAQRGSRSALRNPDLFGKSPFARSLSKGCRKRGVLRPGNHRPTGTTRTGETTVWQSSRPTRVATRPTESDRRRASRAPRCVAPQPPRRRNPPHRQNTRAVCHGPTHPAPCAPPYLVEAALNPQPTPSELPPAGAFVRLATSRSSPASPASSRHSCPSQRPVAAPYRP